MAGLQRRIQETKGLWPIWWRWDAREWPIWDVRIGWWTGTQGVQRGRPLERRQQPMFSGVALGLNATRGVGDFE